MTDAPHPLPRPFTPRRPPTIRASSGRGREPCGLTATGCATAADRVRGNAEKKQAKDCAPQVWANGSTKKARARLASIDKPRQRLTAPSSRSGFLIELPEVVHQAASAKDGTRSISSGIAGGHKESRCLYTETDRGDAVASPAKSAAL